MRFTKMQGLGNDYVYLDLTELTFPPKTSSIKRLIPANVSMVIRLGIGDVTQPLAPAVIDAMGKAVEEMGRKETFRGYCEETCCAYDFLRFAIRDDYKRRPSISKMLWGMSGWVIKAS